MLRESTPTSTKPSPDSNNAPLPPHGRPRGSARPPSMPPIFGSVRSSSSIFSGGPATSRRR